MESALKSIPVFRPEFAYFSFFLSLMWSSYTPGSSLENHTRFQTKIGEVYTRFRRFSDQNAAKTPVPLGWHIATYMAYIGESPLPPGLAQWEQPLKS